MNKEVLILVLHWSSPLWGTDTNNEKRTNLKVPIFGFSLRSDGKMLPFPRRLMRMWSWAAALITASICCAFSQQFSFFPCIFYCELLPLLCVIFPIHTQAFSMSHSKCSLLRSRPKVLLQTDSLFMVFSSINGLLSPDTMGYGTNFYFSTKQEPCYKYYCVETFVLQNYFHSQIQKLIQVAECSPTLFKV